MLLFYVLARFVIMSDFISLISLILFSTGEMSVEVTVCDATDLEDGQSVNQISNIIYLIFMCWRAQNWNKEVEWGPGILDRIIANTTFNNNHEWSFDQLTSSANNSYCCIILFTLKMLAIIYVIIIIIIIILLGY